MNLRLFLVVALCTAAFSAFAQTNVDNGAQAEIAVAAHDIARGDVIAASDLTSKSISALRANDSLVRAVSDAAGKEARRALRTGEQIRISDLKRPTLVAKGATVTMIFEVPGMRLTSVGRAMAEGGEGETIAILNPTSYRQVQAVVTGPGMARVGATNPNPAKVSDKVAAAQP